MVIQLSVYVWESENSCRGQREEVEDLVQLPAMLLTNFQCLPNDAVCFYSLLWHGQVGDQGEISHHGFLAYLLYCDTY